MSVIQFDILLDYGMYLSLIVQQKREIKLQFKILITHLFILEIFFNIDN